jgi:hypothetical protein
MADGRHSLVLPLADSLIRWGDSDVKPGHPMPNNTRHRWLGAGYWADSWYCIGAGQT